MKKKSTKKKIYTPPSKPVKFKNTFIVGRHTTG